MSTQSGSLEFTGKVALVTGGGSGIGAATCRLLHARGARVVVTDYDLATAKAVADNLPGGESSAMDVADAAAVDEVFARVAATHGQVDIVVHAAGVDDADAKAQIAEALTEGRVPQVTFGLTDAAWRRVISVNLDGTFHVLRAGVRAMSQTGGGAIVAVGSSASFDSPIGYPHYSASKAGVHALCQSVAKEVIPLGIRVNVVAPGPTNTGMAARTPTALVKAMEKGSPHGYATPEEIAEVALFLVGDRATNVVGEVILANGGRFTV